MKDSTIEKINKVITPAQEISKQNFSGHVDALENGFINGWAMDKNDIEKRLTVQVKDGDTILCTGKADAYREDLKENLGIGDGKYGFRLEVLDKWSLGIKNVQVFIVDEETGVNITQPSAPFNLGNKVEIDSVNAAEGELVVILNSRLPLGQQRVFLFNDDILIDETEINTSDIKVNVNFNVPLYLRNGKSHLYKVKVMNHEGDISDFPFTFNKPNKKLFFFPDYTKTNPYQDLLYSKFKNIDVEPLPIEEAIRYQVESKSNDCVFHIHWQNIITGGAKTAYEHRLLAKDFLTKVQTFKQNGGSVIWTIHNKLPHDIKFKNPEVEFHESLAELVDVIHLHDLSSVNIVEKEYKIDRSKIKIIKHGDYIDSYLNTMSIEKARHILNIPAENLVFGFVGQLRPYKGLDVFIDAASKITRLANVSAIIAGKPVWPLVKGKITQQCQIHEGINVFEDFIPDNELQVYINSSDFIVLPYKEILTSGSVFLAASFGKPIIVPDIPAFQTLKTEEFIFTYDPSIKNSLYNLLESLGSYDKELIKKIGKKSIDYARSLSWNDISSELLGVANELINPVINKYSAKYNNHQHDVDVYGAKPNRGMAICVVNYFSIQQIECLVKSLRHFNKGGWTLYILDNSSSISEFNNLKIKFNDAILIKPSSNLGYAAGNNILINYAIDSGADKFSILNPDIILCENTIDYMRVVLQECDGMHSPVILRDSGTIAFHSTTVDESSMLLNIKHQYNDSERYLLPSGTSDTDTLNGCALFFNKNFINRFGYIPEEYFLYFEETDWTWNAKKQGSKLVVHNTRSIIHTKDSQKGGLPSLAYTYYLLRGALIFARKHGFNISKTRMKYEETFVRPWEEKIRIKRAELLNVFSTVALAAFEDGAKGVSGVVDIFDRIEKYSPYKDIDSTAFIDECNNGYICGWAITDKNDVDSVAELLVYDAGTYIKTIRANIERKDVGSPHKSGFSERLIVNDLEKLLLVDSKSLKRAKYSNKNIRNYYISKTEENRKSNFKSRIDGIKNGCLSGWALDLNNQDIPLDIDIFINKKLVSKTVANKYRKDLERANLNGGQCAYSIIVPPNFLQENNVVQVDIRLSGEDIYLSEKSIAIEIDNNNYDVNSDLATFLNWSYINVITPYGLYEESKKLQRELSFIKSNLIDKAKVTGKELSFSVIMPVFNRSDLVLDSIDSILRQSYKNFELVIIDDGSNDDTCEIIRKVISQNSNVNIELIELCENKGVSFARNRGLEKATGDIITYLDSDNVWDEDYLLILNDVFVSNEHKSAYAGQEIFYYDHEMNIEFRTAVRLLPFNRSKIENENFIDLNVFSHRNSLFNELGGFREDLRRLVDWDLILKYTAENPPLLIPALMNKYYFGLAANQITTTENYEDNLHKLLEGF